jgi:pyridoxine 5-phosphate synthase
MILLGVNIDHVATVRNARGGLEPDPIQAALIAEAYGADGITAHLREDRRHIKDADIVKLKNAIKTRLNLEMAATDEMVEIALRINPHMVTLVPERREEITTEGGLNVAELKSSLQPQVKALMDAGILVSMFIAPDGGQIEASQAVGAPYIELHTGEYAHAFLEGPAHTSQPLRNLIEAAKYAKELGLKVNAGHGLTYDNVQPVLAIPGLVELNIGHNIISKAIFTGLGPAVAEMKALLS